MNLKEKERTVSTPRGERSEASSDRPRAVSHVMLYLVLAMLVFVPLLTGAPLLTSTGKVLTFEILGSVLLATIIAQGEIGNLRTLRQALTAGPNLPIVLLTFLCLISYASAPYKSFAMTETLRVAFCALAYGAVLTNTESKLPLLIYTVLFVGAAASMIGLATMGSGNYVENDGVTGSFGTHEQLGSFLMLCLPLAVAIGLFYKDDARLNTAALVSALLIVSCLLVSRCRSAWISEVVALATLGGLSVRYIFDKNQLSRQKHLIVAPILLFMVCVGYFVLSSHTNDVIQSRAVSLGRLSQDNSISIRRRMWRDALKMIAAKPALGHGIGQYPIASTQYGNTGMPASYVINHGPDLRNNAHSYYLQMIAEIGLLGFGFYAAAIAAFFVTGFRALSVMPHGLRKSVLAGVLAAMAGQVVDAADSPSYVFASVSLLQWTLMGMGMYVSGLPARWRGQGAARRRLPSREQAPL